MIEGRENLRKIRQELAARRHAMEMLGLLREVTYAPPQQELLLRIDRLIHEVMGEPTKEEEERDGALERAASHGQNVRRWQG